MVFAAYLLGNAVFASLHLHPILSPTVGSGPTVGHLRSFPKTKWQMPDKYPAGGGGGLGVGTLGID